ncbi:hypothetical protein DDB_G0274895 [Dictyostelium discoideum AX4]|uniref:Uncharacterized protein n=1 Tax=Dictyostelium discoideum TaxID=44689 RepID=Q86HN3_DICDI|nr:hypothetical protein DDB_G0274895 [Dictyostelium discoideum AX4]EAL70340.1 hypothetical protein DDB_G0274895 [Dictyostelium discoideum AX4]|eukprot:XP_644108.1 hypothetical protein DDB_G0274895 [Dictyostelium discoideum AX4]
MKSILLILILFFSSCLAQSCFDSNGLYISSIIPVSSNGGEAVFFGCFLTNRSMTISIGNSECTFINQTDYEYVCYAQPGNGFHSVFILVDGLIYYTLHGAFYYYDSGASSATTTTNPSTIFSSSTTTTTTSYASTAYSSSTTSYPSTTYSSSTTGYPSTTFSSSTTSYPSSSSSSSSDYSQPTICEYSERGLTINGSSSFIKCNGYGPTYCVDNIGGSTCQSDTNAVCTVQNKVSNENSITCFGNHIQCFSLYARCSINIPNNQFHVNGELQTSNIVEISSPNETKEMDDLGSPSSSSSSSLYVPTVSIIIFIIISIL